LGASVCQINRLADTAEVLMALNTFARIRRPSPPLSCVPHRGAMQVFTHSFDYVALGFLTVCLILAAAVVIRRHN
jgi:hypothetical protein